MKIIWFSEIKWSYLRTRKQNILTQFKASDEILFIEPISFNLKNKFNISIQKNIKNITIPQIQNSDINLINHLINFYPIKKIIKIISFYMVNKLIKTYKPELIITSNVFWIDYISKLKNKLNLKIVYDCNDNPLAFPNSLNKKQYFYKTIKFSDKIIVPLESYMKFIPSKFHKKVSCISNGVDKELILRKKINLKNFNRLDNVVIYVGSIDTRLDFDLLDDLSTNLNNYNFVFIGDVKKQSESNFSKILIKKNTFHYKSIEYSQMGQCLLKAKVALIPFKKNLLSENILPNKIFELSILGVPFIMTNFNDDLKKLNSEFEISDNINDFIEFIKKESYDRNKINNLIDFANKYKWKDLAQKYRNILKSIIN